MKILKVVCGVPGCGKTTYIKNHAQPEDDVISRDEIRNKYLDDPIKNFLVPAEELQKRYFAKEKKVFREFCEKINKSNCSIVWADATHLNSKSRWKLLYNIDLSQFDKIIFIAIEEPLDVCLARNSKREGLARVPDKIIANMFENYKRPTCNEFLSLNNIEIEVIKNY